MAQHHTFREVLQALRNEGIKHMLRYPAKLHVYPRDGGSTQDLHGPKQAARSLRRDNVREGE